MPWEVLDLAGQIQHLHRDRMFQGIPVLLGLGALGGQRRPAVQLLGEGVLLPGRVTHRLGHVAHRHPRPEGVDVGDLRGALAAVPLVDVLDDLLTPVGLDVDVDVRRPVPLRSQEALEQQGVPHGVHRGDAQRVADRRVGRRTPSLAEDVLLLAEHHDVVHDQEVAREVQLGDDLQFVFDLGVGGRVGRPASRTAARRRPWSAARSSIVLVHARAAPRTAAGSGRPASGRTHTPRRVGLRSAPRWGSGRTGPPSRHRTAGAPTARPAGRGRPRPGCSGPDRGHRRAEPAGGWRRVVRAGGGDDRQAELRRPARPAGRCPRRRWAPAGRSARRRRCPGRIGRPGNGSHARRRPVRRCAARAGRCPCDIR